VYRWIKTNRRLWCTPNYYPDVCLQAQWKNPLRPQGIWLQRKTTLPGYEPTHHIIETRPCVRIHRYLTKMFLNETQNWQEFRRAAGILTRWSDNHYAYVFIQNKHSYLQRDSNTHSQRLTCTRSYGPTENCDMWAPVWSSRVPNSSFLFRRFHKISKIDY
jgi:hypothetical protein